MNIYAHIAQSVEHFLGKEEVTGSSPVVGYCVCVLESKYVGKAECKHRNGWSR